MGTIDTTLEQRRAERATQTPVDGFARVIPYRTREELDAIADAREAFKHALHLTNIAQTPEDVQYALLFISIAQQNLPESYSFPEMDARIKSATMRNYS